MVDCGCRRLWLGRGGRRGEGMMNGIGNVMKLMMGGKG